MEVNFVVKNTLKRWGRTPFYSGKQIWPLGENCANPVESSVGPAPEPDGSVPGPENRISTGIRVSTQSRIDSV